MSVYEIYEVPNLELDGTEIYLDEAKTLDEAEEKYEELSINRSNLWIIIASDEEGYEKVVRS